MIEEFARIWRFIWGFLGPSILATFILHLFYPEKFERVGIHVLIRVLREEVLAKRLHIYELRYVSPPRGSLQGYCQVGRCR